MSPSGKTHQHTHTHAQKEKRLEIQHFFERKIRKLRKTGFILVAGEKKENQALLTCLVAKGRLVLKLVTSELLNQLPLNSQKGSAASPPLTTVPSYNGPGSKSRVSQLRPPQPPRGIDIHLCDRRWCPKVTRFPPSLRPSEGKAGFV